jgi:hypothetical protein
MQPTQYSISTILTLAEISQYLASNDIQKKQLLNWGILDEDLDKKIYAERKGVQWLYENNPTASYLNAYAQYLYTLCGYYIPKALVISGNASGGTVLPNTPSYVIQYVNLDFIIGQAGSPMNAGDTVLTINDTVIPDSLSIVLDGQVLYPDVADQISYHAAYTNNQTIITFNQSVQTGQKYQIKYTKQGQVTNSGTIVQLQTPVIYTATGGETTFNVPQIATKKVYLVTRGGIEVGNILSSGTPTGSDITINFFTGDVTLSTDNPAAPNEKFKFLYA